MGQQQSSLAAKGAHHPSLSHKIADSPAESVQMEDTSFQQQQPNNAQLTPPASTADLTAGVSSSSQVCTMEVQSKSVRAAIDSFIENCLAGGSDNGTPPPQIRVDEDRGQSSDVEICEVIPTEGKHVAGSPATDDKHKNSASTSGQSGAHEHQSSVLSQEDVQESSQRDPSIGQQPETETGTTAAEDSVSVKNKIDCQTESQADKPGADDQNTVSEKSSRAGGAKGPAGTVDNSKSNQGEDSNQSKGTTDDSSDGDGVVSVRFKTIIDRVLDTSLGIGPDLSSIPHEQRILSQLAADEKAAATRSTMAVSDVSNKKDNSSTSSEKKIEPMAVCFMDHIEKAVERSFSSITEEEERKEKEKALAAREAMREADGKQPSWGTRQAKTETSGGDSTISVQDIVDRVISQTEVISKLMTTSAGASSQTDTKPTATAAGTFYPSRAPADLHHHLPRREVPSKEYIPKDTERRRGRPRIRSPYHDAREAPNQEYPSGGSNKDVSGSRVGSSGGVTGEDYLHPMQAAMARFGPTHPSGQGMHPFVPSALPTSAAGFLPVSTMHPAVVAAAAAGLHPTGLHPVHNTPSHHNPNSQPPPLLRVSPVNRLENPLQQQQKHTHPSYFSQEREPSSGQLLPPPDNSMPHLSPHTPQHNGSLKAGIAAPHSQSPRYLHPSGADPRHMGHDVGKPQKAQALYPPSNVPSSVYQVATRSSQGAAEGYHVNHHAYGVQGVSVAGLAYPESKRVSDSLPADPHHTKLPERGDYHRPGPVAYGTSASGFVVPVGGEQSGMMSRYPPDVLAGKQLPLQHLSAVSGKPRPEEGPVLDLTMRRDEVHQPAYTDDEKPLDLSKKPLSSNSAHEKQNLQYHSNDLRQHPNLALFVDTHGRSVTATMPVMDKRRDSDKLMSGSRHLHKLETSVETYFQKLHQTPHPHGAQVPVRAVPVSHGNALPANSVPMSHPSHHPMHRSQNAFQSSSVSQQPAGYAQATHAGSRSSPYNSDPLLSPTGNRRPQLHPIPAPSLATTLGPSVTPRGASPYQSRAGASHPGVPVSTPTHTPVLNSPHSQPLPPVSTPSLEAANAPYNDSSGVVMNQKCWENVHPQGSRSVSPPGSERRSSSDDRRRGSVSKHEPITNILGNNNPADILYLICRLCRQTYGSPYGFRKHFRNQHGFEPKAEHTIVQTISATKNARQLSGNPQGFDIDGQSEEALRSFHQNVSSVDSVSHGQTSVSPQSDMGPAVADSPQSHSSKSPTDFPQHAGDGEKGAPGQFAPHKYRRLSRNSTDSRGRPASGNGSSMAVGGTLEEREDTKCLECPECGQAFQLNDFGSYKRHCRQHGQMRGVAGATGTGGPGLYTCTDCQCSFSEPHLLQEHLVRHEAHTAPAVCQLCRLSFPSVSQLQEHLRTVHSDSAPAQSPSSPSSSSATPTLTNSKRPSDSASAVSRPSVEVPAHSSSCISSSTNVQSSYGTSKMGPDSSVSNFSLKVTTPSDLKVQRLPADHIVTSASPDSSSDNKNAGGSPQSSSVQLKIDNGKSGDTSADVDSPKVKVEQDSKIPSRSQLASSEDDKDSGYSGERCPSNDSRSVSTEGSLASPMETEESTELFLYKHKKFGAHRKRTGSNDVPEPDAKQARVEASGVDSSTSSSQKSDSNIEYTSTCEDEDTSVTGSASIKLKSEVSTKSARPGFVASGDGVGSGAKKTEARHHMPCVLERVLRSQAGRNARTTDNS